MEELKELFYSNNGHIDNLYQFEEEFNYKLKSLIAEYETEDINILYNIYKAELEIKYINNCYKRLYENIEISNDDIDVDIDDDDLPSDIEDEPELKKKVIEDIKLTKVENYKISELIIEKRIKIKGFNRDINLYR